MIALPAKTCPHCGGVIPREPSPALKRTIEAIGSIHWSRHGAIAERHKERLTKSALTNRLTAPVRLGLVERRGTRKAYEYRRLS